MKHSPELLVRFWIAEQFQAHLEEFFHRIIIGDCDRPSLQ